MKSKSKKITWASFTLKIIISALCGYGIVVYALTPMIAVMFTKIIIANKASAWALPLQLKIAEQECTTGAKFECFGYSWKSPWLGATQITTNDTFIKFQMEDGDCVAFFNPLFFAGQITPTLTQWNHTWLLKTKPGETQITYALCKESLMTSPHEMHLFTTRQNALRKLRLLMLKTILITEDNPVVSLFEENGFSGFQLGDPLKDRRIVDVIFYDDNSYVVFVCGGVLGNTKVQQNNINCLLRSITKIKQ